MHLPRWLTEQPEEVWFFLRIAAYAFFIGTVYWFLTYEAAGTMLLYGFGLAAGTAMLILAFAARRRRRAEDEARARGIVETPEEGSTDANGPFGDDRGRIPSPSIAPFAIGLGAAVLGLGLILGPWLLLVGLIAALLGAVEWLAAAQRELRAVESEGAEPAPRPDTQQAEDSRMEADPRTAHAAGVAETRGRLPG